MIIYIPGDPVGKERPRHTRSGNTYTPEKTKAYEAKVAAAWKKKQGPMFTGPVRVRIAAHYAIPKSATKAKQEAMLKGKIRPTKRPDIDNVIKCLTDGANGVAYKDDAQIVTIAATRYYAREPGVWMEIQEET